MKRMTFYTGALVVAVFNPVVVFAASAGHHHVPSVADLLYPAINFVLFVGLLFFLLKERFPQGIKGRRARIVEAVEAAGAQMQAAHQEFEKAKHLLDQVDQEVAEMAARIEREAQGEAEALLRAATEQGAAISAQAERSAAAELKSAEERIRKMFAERVIEKASERLKLELNTDNDQGRRAAALEGLRGLLS